MSFSSLRRFRTPALISLFLCITFTAGVALGYLTNHVWSENGTVRSFFPGSF